MEASSWSPKHLFVKLRKFFLIEMFYLIFNLILTCIIMKCMFLKRVLDIFTGEEDQPNASNGSAKTVPRVARSSGRISRFQVFNLLQHDTDKNLRQAPTSPTQVIEGSLASCYKYHQYLWNQRLTFHSYYFLEYFRPTFISSPFVIR